MNISNLTANQLRSALKLLETKEALQAELAALDAKLANFSSEPAKVVRRGRPPGSKSGASASPAAPATPRRGRKSGPNGSVKDLVLSDLRAAGPQGRSIQELSERLKKTVGHLYNWFGSKGKEVPGLEKVARGRYRLAS